MAEATTEKRGRGFKRPEFTGPLSVALREAIRDFPRGSCVIGRDASVIPGIISDFMRLKKSMQLEMAERIARVVGVRLIPTDTSDASGLDEVEQPRTFEDLIRSAIKSHPNIYQLAIAADVHYSIPRSILFGVSKPLLWSADRLIASLPLKVERWTPPTPQSKKSPRQSLGLDLFKPVLDRLKTAVKASGISNPDLEKASGVNRAHIWRFLEREGNLSPFAAAKIAMAIGVDLNGIGDALSKPCPIRLMGQGETIYVGREATPAFRGVAYRCVEFAVERFPAGCTGSELSERTESERPIRLLMPKLKDPRWSALDKVLKWDGAKGGMLRIVDSN